MIYCPQLYLNNDPFKSDPDIHYESGKENWSGVFGLLIFPILLVLTGFTLFKVFNGESVVANVPYQNGGFINMGTQVGVGGAPPTMTPVSQTDLSLHSSNFIKGNADGFISKTAYESGARVYISVQSMYDQDCTKNGKTMKESQNITINKGVETYSAQTTSSNEINGYMWTVDFDISSPMNLCALGYTQGKITQRLAEGRVFLSKDGGVTQVADPKTNLPIQAGLTP